MTNLTLHIENNATLEALLPLLQHLGVRHDIWKNNDIAEPAIAYAKPKPKSKQRLEDVLLPKPKNIDWEAVEKTIAEGVSQNFDTEAMLQHLKECRTDRPMPFREN